MKKLSFLFLLLATTFCAKSQVTAPPDSILKKVENLKNVTAIKHIKNTFSNGNTKSEGWAYLFQDGNKTKYVRLGHWQYFRSNGTMEFEDFMPVKDEAPIREVYYDKSGKIKVKEVLQSQEFDKNNNLVKGTYTEMTYHDNGQLATVSSYKSKKKVGVWKWYDESGKETNQKDYSQTEAQKE